MNIIMFYEDNAMQALIRAQENCQEEGLKQIQTLFLVKEILKDPDCKLYEYFQDEFLDSRYVEETLETCMLECVDSVKKEMLNRELEEEEVDETEVDEAEVDETELDKAEVQSDVEKGMSGEAEERQEDELSDDFMLKIDYDGKEYEFYLSKELAGIIYTMQEEVLQTGRQIAENDIEDVKEGNTLVIRISLNAVLCYIVKLMPQDMARFLRRLDLKVSEVKDAILGINEQRKVEISDGMKTFLTDITAEYQEGAKNLILGREKETKQIWDIVSKMNKRNAILTGEPGVGKTAIIQKMAQDIKNGMCPEKFKNHRIISLDVNSVIAGTTFRGQAEERFNKLNMFLENTEDVILFIDEIHTILGAGACRNGEMDLANSMKPILARGKAIVIGATTTEEYKKYFSQDGALKRRFEKVEVQEPKTEEIYPMLKNKIQALEEYHGVRVSKEIVDFIIFTAACFNYETRNPDRTLDLLDRSLVVAKNAGKTILDRFSVLENYNVNFERFKRMSLNERKSVAYHEAGHFVVNTMSGRLKAYSTVAVSIMPTDCYLGVNALEETDENVSPNMEYYIDLMASYLAGREAERLISESDNSGISSDLKKATKTAYDLVTKYGMVEGYNMVFFQNGEIKMLSEKATDRINQSVQDLLNEAEKRAKEILTENRDLLDTIAIELLKKRMLSKKDLARIVKNVGKKVTK